MIHKVQKKLINVNRSKPPFNALPRQPRMAEGGKISGEAEALKEQNRYLAEQISILRRQFDDSIALNKDCEKISQQCREKDDQIQKLKLEVSELSRRRAISDQKAEEFRSQLSNKQKEIDLSLKLESGKYKALMSQQKEEYSSRISSLQEKLSSFEGQKAIESQIREVLDASSGYFRSKISTIGELKAKFCMPRPLLSISTNSFSDFERFGAETHFLNSQMVKETMNYYESQIIDLQKRNESIQKSKEDAESAASSLRDRVASLAAELSSLQTQAILSKAKEVSQKSADQSIESFTKELTILRERNSELNKKLNESIQKVGEIEETHAILQKKYKSAKSELKCLKESASRAKEEKDSMQRELLSIGNELQMQKTDKTDSVILKSQIEKQKMESSQLSKSVVVLDEQLSSQAAEIERLNSEKSRMLAVILKISKAIPQIDNLISISARKEENLKAKVVEFARNSSKSSEKNEVIPLSAWSCPEFPRELTESIHNSVSADCAGLQSKLRVAMSIIARWYASQNERLSTQNRDLSEKVEKYNETISNFQKILMCESGATLSEALVSLHNKEAEQRTRIEKMEESEKDNSEKVDNIVIEVGADTYRGAIQKVKDLKMSEKKLKSEVVSIRKSLSVLREGTSKALMQLKRSAENLREEANELKSEISNLRSNHLSQMKQLSVSSSAQRGELLNCIESMRKKCASLRSSNRTIRAQLDSLLKERTQLISASEGEAAKATSKFGKAKAAIKKASDIEKMSKEKIKAERSVITAQCEEMIRAMEAENRKLRAKIDELNIPLASTQKEIDTLKEKNSNLSEMIKRGEEREKAINEERNREVRLCKARARAEVAKAESDFNSKIEVLQFKLNEAKKASYSAVTLHFAEFFDPKEKMTDENFDAFLRRVESKLKDLKSEDLRLREMLQIGPQQSVVDGVASAMLGI